MQSGGAPVSLAEAFTAPPTAPMQNVYQPAYRNVLPSDRNGLGSAHATSGMSLAQAVATRQQALQMEDSSDESGYGSDTSMESDASDFSDDEQVQRPVTRRRGGAVTTLPPSAQGLSSGMQAAAPATAGAYVYRNGAQYAPAPSNANLAIGSGNFAAQACPTGQLPYGYAGQQQQAVQASYASQLMVGQQQETNQTNMRAPTMMWGNNYDPMANTSGMQQATRSLVFPGNAASATTASAMPTAYGQPAPVGAQYVPGETAPPLQQFSLAAQGNNPQQNTANATDSFNDGGFTVYDPSDNYTELSAVTIGPDGQAYGVFTQNVAQSNGGVIVRNPEAQGHVLGRAHPALETFTGHGASACARPVKREVVADAPVPTFDPTYGGAQAVRDRIEREQRAQREMFFNRGNETMVGEMERRPSTTIGLQDMRTAGRNWNPTTLKASMFNNTQNNDRMPSADAAAASGGTAGFTAGRGAIFYENGYDNGRTAKMPTAAGSDTFDQGALVSSQTQSRVGVKSGTGSTTRLGAPAGAEPVFASSLPQTQSRPIAQNEVARSVARGAEADGQPMRNHSQSKPVSVRETATERKTIAISAPMASTTSSATMERRFTHQASEVSDAVTRGGGTDVATNSGREASATRALSQRDTAATRTGQIAVGVDMGLHSTAQTSGTSLATRETRVAVARGHGNENVAGSSLASETQSRPFSVRDSAAALQGVRQGVVESAALQSSSSSRPFTVRETAGSATGVRQVVEDAASLGATTAANTRNRTQLQERLNADVSAQGTLSSTSTARAHVQNDQAAVVRASPTIDASAPRSTTQSVAPATRDSARVAREQVALPSDLPTLSTSTASKSAVMRESAYEMRSPPAGQTDLPQLQPSATSRASQMRESAQEMRAPPAAETNLPQIQPSATSRASQMRETVQTRASAASVQAPQSAVAPSAMGRRIQVNETPGSMGYGQSPNAIAALAPSASSKRQQMTETANMLRGAGNDVASASVGGTSGRRQTNTSVAQSRMQGSGPDVEFSLAAAQTQTRSIAVPDYQLKARDYFGNSKIAGPDQVTQERGLATWSRGTERRDTVSSEIAAKRFAMDVVQRKVMESTVSPTTRSVPRWQGARIDPSCEQQASEKEIQTNASLAAAQSRAVGSGRERRAWQSYAEERRSNDQGVLREGAMMSDTDGETCDEYDYETEDETDTES